MNNNFPAGLSTAEWIMDLDARLQRVENYLSLIYGNPNVHECSQPTRPFINSFPKEPPKNE